MSRAACVHASGRIKDGQDRYTTEIVASEMQMLDSRGGASGGDAGYEQSAPRQSAPRQSAPRQSAPTQSEAPPANFDDFDDDIPF